MESDKRNRSKLEDGRPVEVREGDQEPQSTDEGDEDIPDASTVENVGY
jgi:hypothetical protein